MKKSTLLLIHSLNNKLLEFPKLVDSLNNKDINFIKNLYAWILELETILVNHQISEVSEIAGLRSKIVATKYSDNKKNSIKILQLKIASEILYDLQNTVLNILKPKEIKIHECRELIRKLLIISSQSENLKYNSKQSFEFFLQEIWKYIISNDKLVAGSSSLKSILTLPEIYQLLAEEINLEDF